MTQLGWAQRATLASALISLLLGTSLWARHLGDIPPYGDTKEYLERASRPSAGPQRGLLYPLVLRIADELSSEPVDPGLVRRRFGVFPRSLWTVQVFQTAVLLAALAYFAHVLLRCGAGAERGPPAGLAAAGAVLLVLFDPLVAHFNLAILTDSLALAASLAFVAALVRLALDGSRPLLPVAILVAAAVAGEVRVERTWVLLATGVASLLSWRWLAKGVPSLRRAALLLAAFVVAGAAVAAMRSAGGEERPTRAPLRVHATHLRIVFPHLGESYAYLPEAVRAAIPPEEALRHDRSPSDAVRVFKRVRPREDRFALIADAARVVLRRHGGEIAADIAKDALENLFATASFYGRLALLVGGAGAGLGPGDRTAISFERLTRHHPVHVALAMAASVVALLAAGIQALRPGSGPQRGRRWLPVALLCLFLASGFAAYLDVSNLRYGLVSHAVVAFWVYSRGLRACLEGGRFFPRAKGPQE